MSFKKIEFSAKKPHKNTRLLRETGQFIKYGKPILTVFWPVKNEEFWEKKLWDVGWEIQINKK